MKVIFSEKSIVEATYDDKNKTVHVKWHALGGHKFVQPSCLAQAEAVKKGAKFLVVDVSECKGTPSQEDQDFFGKTLFPEFEKNGLKALITVVPTSGIGKMGSNRWKKTASTFKFELYEVDAVADAQQLIKNLTSKAA